MNHFPHTDLSDTICALATPSGVGAIGVIRISGPQSIAMVNQLFAGKNLEAAASHTVHFGKIKDGNILLDEVLVSVFRNPTSFTGEDSVEISCHGSTYILQKMLELLVRSGMRLAKPGEFTLRAFLNKKMDLAQAEAVADVIAAESAAAHQTAMQQMRGGYSKQIEHLREQLINFASLIELELDFAEEDVAFASKTELHALVTQIHQLLEQLLQSFQYGNVVKNGVPTVIAGKPNAGKSTLLNALLNEERAIVSNIAGTTRDTIEETFVVNGIVFRLIDTAGIRKSTDTIEAIGIERTYEAIAKAALVLYVFDASTTTQSQLNEELAQLPKGNYTLLLVANKIDLGNAAATNGQQVIPVSSLHKQGMEQLLQALQQFTTHNQSCNNLVVTNLRHYESFALSHQALTQVLNAIHNGFSGELLALDIRKAIFHLGEITGQITTDDLLGNIFSKFCIGK